VPLTILILTNRIPYPLRDGGALAMDAMIKGYHDAGMKVHLLAMNTSRHFVRPEVRDTLYTELAGFDTIDVDNAVTTAGILKNLLFSREPEHAERFTSAAFAAKLSQLLRVIQPHVVQLESPFLAGYLPVIRNESKALLVYRMHNVEGQIWSRLAAESSGLKRAYLQILAKRLERYEQRLWRVTDLLLPITGADARAVKKAGINTPVEVAPFGIHPPDTEQKWPPGHLKAYHIGAMDWLANRDAVSWFLKEVWPKLHAISPRITFHFAGRAMPDSFYGSLPEGAYCEGEVGDAQAFIQDKHMLVVPLRSGGGIRIKILEAMAQGKLVISTNVGMQGIEAVDHVHYLSANTAQEFVRLIAWAGAHPDKAASIAQAAQRLIREQYNAAVIMARIIRRLEAMIAGT
jgi:hypothetical protein